MNKTRTNQVTFRASDKEKEQIQKKIEQSKISQQDYLLRCALKKKIVVVEGVNELNLELRRIGNNLNQIAKALNQNKLLGANDQLAEIDKEMKKLWQLSSQLTQNQV